MLVPPSSGVLSSVVDPLRKRPTTFSRTNKDVEIDHSAWTETPSQKADRLKEEAKGVKRKTVNGDDEFELERKRQRDEEIRREVERHNVRCLLSYLVDHADSRKDVGRVCWNNIRLGISRKMRLRLFGIMREIWALRGGC